jgi:hypothetical protein
MSKEEDEEYEALIVKRENNAMTNKEYNRYKVLVDKAFLEGIPKLAKSWAAGFGLNRE